MIGSSHGAPYAVHCITQGELMYSGWSFIIIDSHI